MIILEQVSMLTGNKHRMEIPTTKEKLDIFFDPKQKATRPLIQDLFPELTTDEREFVQTGITPEEWELETNTEAQKLTYEYSKGLK